MDEVDWKSDLHGDEEGGVVGSLGDVSEVGGGVAIEETSALLSQRPHDDPLRA